MTMRVLEVGWTETGTKPHLIDPERRGKDTFYPFTYCGWPAIQTRRRRVALSDEDPAGGLCQHCEVHL